MNRRYAYIMHRFDEDIRISFFKIGMSKDPWRRAKQVGAELLATFHRSENSEKELHRRFAHLRLQRDHWPGYTEWFLDDSGEIGEFLRSFGIEWPREIL